MKKRLPGRFAHILCCLLALVMTLTLLLGALSWQGVRMLTDRELHHRIAGSDAVVDQQMNRITALVEETAQAWSFAPETVLELVTREAMQTYSLQCADWWLGLMQPDGAYAAPLWDSKTIEKAVQNDPQFRRAYGPQLRRTISRDQVASVLEREILETVLPVRSQIVTMLMPRVREKLDIPALMAIVRQIPLVLVGASLLMALLMLIVMRRKLCKAGLYVGSALSAAALLTLGLCLALQLADPAAFLVQANALLGLQAGLLLRELRLPLLIASGAALAAGLALIFAHQRIMDRYHAIPDGQIFRSGDISGIEDIPQTSVEEMEQPAVEEVARTLAEELPSTVAEETEQPTA